MWSIILLLVIAAAIGYSALFVKYKEAVAYYGEEPIGFHAWVKKFIVALWHGNKL